MEQAGPVFGGEFRTQFLELLRWRRDVRHFRRDPLPAVLLTQLLEAAWLAPSVGYSQPWRFVEVQSEAAREAVRANFATCNADALASYQGERAQHYATLKLAGLNDAPVQLAVFTDGGTEVGHRLGRRTMPQTLDFSTVMAIQNFWLAARAAGVGLGWVSILDPEALSATLAVPREWRFTAYLCVGYPVETTTEPELQRRGWETAQAASRSVLVR